MPFSAKFLSPSAAARRLGTTIKALRLYEEHGLLSPDRNASGWRVYAPNEMARAAQVVALRALGLSMAQIGRALRGEDSDLIAALTAHEAALNGQVRRLNGAIERVRVLRDDLDDGRRPSLEQLHGVLTPLTESDIAFDLPWPWAGERFELRGLRAITYVTGPLGSGKTRLIERIAETLPNATLLGLDRMADHCTASRSVLGGNPDLRNRVDGTMTWLVEDGAVASPALFALLAAVEADTTAALVIDMPEQGLDAASQQALIAFLRRRRPVGRPVVLLTRSSAILDLASVGESETIILCPANHSVPIVVRPHFGAPWYEATATCLASPEVRSRTEGVIAMRPEAR